MRTLRIRQWRIWLLWILLIFGAMVMVKGLLDLFFMLANEARGPVHEDYLLYTIIGRGMLNGLKPYVDLFESKPPGMFLLAALSLLFTGGERLATAVEVLGFAGIPAAFGLYAWRQTRRMEAQIWRGVITGIVVLFSIQLMLYVEEHSGALQTESFGSFFGILYVLSIGYEGKRTRVALIARSLLLLGTAGMKEPFLLVALAAALLLAKDARHFVRVFLAPLILAGVFGMLGLLVLGSFHSYFTLYLPAMQMRIQELHAEPLLMRGLAVRRIFGNLVDFYIAPLWGFVLLLLWILYPLLLTTDHRWKTAVFSLGMSLLLLHILHSGYVLWDATRMIADHSARPSAYYWRQVIWLVSWTCLWIVLMATAFRRGRSLFWRHLAAGASLYLVCLAVGSGGNYNDYHFAFAGPAYAALILPFLSHLRSDHASLFAFAPVALLLGILVLFYHPSPMHMEKLQAWRRNGFAARASVTQQFDRLLDACHLERFAVSQGVRMVAFAKHSPYGPLMEFAHPYLPSTHPLIRNTHDTIASRAMIMVGDPASTFPDLAPLFGTNAPPCAKGLVPIANLQLSFRSPWKMPE
ncbi:hypothetical protein HY213_05735 [Candidatus Peregrinibacteria bacterium]|nr:hypothetical protein [Candidatus Peregrinibacteria bacterium]